MFIWVGSVKVQVKPKTMHNITAPLESRSSKFEGEGRAENSLKQYQDLDLKIVKTRAYEKLP